MTCPSTVLISVDLSPYSKQAFDWYVERMHHSGNKVYLIHCIEMPSVPTRDTWEMQVKAGKEKAMSLQKTLAAELQERGIEADFIFDFEKPGEYICRCAKEYEANCIIMGTRGMGKIRRTILGSVSNYVLNHAECPVLVCRSPKDKNGD